MKAYTQDVYDAWNTSGRQISIRLTNTDTNTVIDAEILSLAITQGCNSSEYVSIGSAVSAIMEAKLNTSENLTGVNVKVEFGILVDELTKYTKIGEFLVDECTGTTTKTIVAYDLMQSYKQTYSTDITTDTVSLENLITEAVTNYNLTFNPSLTVPNITVNTPADIDCTVRDMVGYVAGCMGGNAYINANNQIEIKQLTAASNVNFDIDNARSLEPSEETIVINSFVANNGVDEFSAGEGKGIYINNPLFTETLFNSLKTAIIGQEFFAGNLILYGNPFLEPGDILNFTYLNTNYYLPAMQIIQSYTGGLTTMITSYSATDTLESSSIKTITDNINIKINAVESRITQSLSSITMELEGKASVSNVESMINTKFEQSLDGFEFSVDEAKASLSDSQEQLDVITSHIIIASDGSMTFTADDIDTKLVLDADKMSFYQGGTEIMYIGTEKIHISSAEVVKMRIGNFEFSEKENGNMIIRKVE